MSLAYANTVCHTKSAREGVLRSAASKKGVDLVPIPIETIGQYLLQQLDNNTYCNNWATIQKQKFKNLTPPTCFGLQWPSSGRGLSKESAVTANCLRDVQI
jgi:hypothetical protein